MAKNVFRMAKSFHHFNKADYKYDNNDNIQLLVFNLDISCTFKFTRHCFQIGHYSGVFFRS